MGSGWLASPLCVAVAPLYAGSGVGNQTTQLWAHQLPTERESAYPALPSGVFFLKNLPTYATLL